MRTRYALLFLMLFTASIENAVGSTSLSYNKKSGLFTISHNTAPTVSAQFVFWHENWHWSDLELTKKKGLGQGRYRIEGKTNAPGTKLSLFADIQQQGARKLIWKIHLDEQASGKKRSWGGIAFTFKNRFFTKGKAAFAPKLTPDRSGWQIRFGANEQPVRVHFAPKPVKLFFEQADKNEIRAYFKSRKGRSAGKLITMTVTLPKSAKITPTLTERLARPSPEWHKNQLLWHSSPVDLSFLNASQKPAGKHGFVRARKGHLYFANGQRARFWGTNLPSYALFGTTAKTAANRRAVSQDLAIIWCASIIMTAYGSIPIFLALKPKQHAASTPDP